MKRRFPNFSADFNLAPLSASLGSKRPPAMDFNAHGWGFFMPCSVVLPTLQRPFQAVSAGPKRLVPFHSESPLTF